jgi:cytochrome c-type biogenesis protein CcsB
MRGFATEVALHWVGVGCYMAAAALLANAVIFRHPERTGWARRLALLGLVPHAAAIALRWAEVGHGPYMLKYEVLSSNAFVAVAFLVIFLWRRPDWGAVGLVVLPVAILAVAFGLFTNPAMRELPPTLRSTWLVFHITFAKLSAGAFLLSLGTAVLLLLEWRPRPGTWLERLPPPEALDAFTVRFIGFGFIFWSVTIAAGAIWAHQSWGRYWGWDAVETWSLVTWLAYGTFLHSRIFFRMGPRKSAWAATVAFAVFVLAAIVLPYAIPSLHSAYFQ